MCKILSRVQTYDVVPKEIKEILRNLCILPEKFPPDRIHHGILASIGCKDILIADEAPFTMSCRPWIVTRVGWSPDQPVASIPNRMIIIKRGQVNALIRQSPYLLIFRAPIFCFIRSLTKVFSIISFLPREALLGPNSWFRNRGGWFDPEVIGTRS